MRGPRLTSLLLLCLAATLSLSQAAAGGERDRPGEFDYYVLVLDWFPSYCAAEGKQRHDRQCETETPHGFVLHGLWPQYENGWPQDCMARKRAWVPQAVIDEMRDIMPSKNLIIHEYRAHGTCAGLEPDVYFGLARDLYERINIPPRFTQTPNARALSPDEIEEEFLKANPWLRPSMITVSCRAQELRDVRVCFGRDLFPQNCGPNEERRLCRSRNVTLPSASSR